MCGKCGVVDCALCGGRNGGLYCLCTANYTVGTGGSAVRHQTRKTAPCVTHKIASLCYTQNCNLLYVKQPLCTICRTAILCYT